MVVYFFCFSFLGLLHHHTVCVCHLSSSFGNSNQIYAIAKSDQLTWRRDLKLKLKWTGQLAKQKRRSATSATISSKSAVVACRSQSLACSSGRGGGVIIRAPLSLSLSGFSLSSAFFLFWPTLRVIWFFGGESNDGDGSSDELVCPQLTDLPLSFF